MSGTKTLSLGFDSKPTIKVHATAIFSILNHFMRRSDGDARVIGTLLGKVEDGVIEVTDCFGVPFIEKTDDLYVAINKDYHKSMYSSLRRITKKEEIVGWYSTTTASGALIVDNSSLVNDFYSQECSNPIHLVVDTTLNNETIDVRGFVSSPITLKEIAFSNMFEEVQVTTIMNDAERAALYHMINHEVSDEKKMDLLQTTNNKIDPDTVIISEIPDERASLISVMGDLIKDISSLTDYVNSVVEGKVEGDPEIGVALQNALSNVNAFKANEVNTQLQDKMQDLLMVAYLSSVMKTQLRVSEKLHAAI